jgi:hypothetical protein
MSIARTKKSWYPPNRMYKQFTLSLPHQTIHSFSSAYTRALTVGYIQNYGKTQNFIPARCNLGVLRQKDTFEATKESLNIPQIDTILKTYVPQKISTVTLLRETLSCNLSQSLFDHGIHNHYGDAFIGATHIKGAGEIKTAYQYENTEGLVPDGLWLIAESFCLGRNLRETMNSLLSQFTPKEIIFVAPLASRRAIEYVGAIIAQKNIPVSYVSWGGLFGVDEKTLYDMPWGHKDTQPVDERDRQTFLKMYGPNLCVGGDFGNNYYSPSIAQELYEGQLKEHDVTPLIPSVEEIMTIYKQEEIQTKKL